MADDDESLDDILSGKETTPEITPEAEPEVTAPVRDEHGRFAPKSGTEDEPEVAAEEETEQPEAEQPEAEHNAPVAAVTAERRKRQAVEARAEKLERDLAEMRGQMSVLMQRAQQPVQQQPQPEPQKAPEFWENPEEFLKHQLQPFQQQQTQQTERFSKLLAVKDHGADTVNAAYQALGQAMQSDPGAVAEYRRIMASEHPYEAMVGWHKRSLAQAEIGNDPAAYRERLRAEILAELGKQPDPQPSPPSNRNAPLVKMPPSLARIPAGHSAPERDESLDEVLSAPRRRA